MKTVNFFVLLALICSFLSACGNKIKTDSSGKEDFNAFYEQFYKDSIFQLQRIEFPMAGLSSEGKEKIWDESNWKLQIPLKKDDPDLKIILQVDEKFARERIIYQNAFLAERNYSLDGNGKKWLLVYYADMHIPTNQSDRLSSGQADSLGSDHENIDTTENSDVNIIVNPKSK
jgi:hypothetical protein